MSLTLSSPAAPQAAVVPAASQTGRSNGQSQSDQDSFGAVLKRSQAGSEKTSDKVPEKTAAQRRPRDQNSSDKTEQPDPASALVLAMIALEPRLAATPADTAPSGSAGTIAAASGTDAGLHAASTPAALLTTPDQGTQEPLIPQLALAALGKSTTDALPKEQAALVATEPQKGDSPALLANVATETSSGLNVQQIALAAASQHEPTQALPPAKSVATIAGNAAAQGAGDAGKVASQALLPDTGTTGQQSKQDDTATDSRDGKFSVKPDLRHTEAPVAASIADAATKGNSNSVPADQFNLGTSTPANPVNMLQQALVGTTQQATATPINLPLTPPVGSNEWGDALGKQVAWMGNTNHQVAELQLNPAGLGPLKITLTINNHQAEALFVSAHPSVRAAVEAALPQLRTNLADNGISLGNTSVSADTQQQNAFAQGQASQSGQGKYRPDSMLNPVADISLPDTTPTIAITGKRSNVDLFA